MGVLKTGVLLNHGNGVNVRQPIVYKAQELKDWDIYKQDNVLKEKWSLARPIGHNLYPFSQRFITAWKVLVGKLDAVDFGDE
jgi:hypothetical protein